MSSITSSTLGKRSHDEIPEEEPLQKKQKISDKIDHFSLIPPEIRLEIAKYLSPSQFRNLVLTSKQFASLQVAYLECFAKVFKIETDKYDEKKSKVQIIYNYIIGISKATTESENEKLPIEKASVPTLFKSYQEQLVSEASVTSQRAAELKKQETPEFQERNGQIYKKVCESELFPFSTVEEAHQWLKSANNSEKEAVLNIALYPYSHNSSFTTLAMFIIESDSNLSNSLMRENTFHFIWANLITQNQTEFAKHLIEKCDQNELYPGSFEGRSSKDSPLYNLIFNNKYKNLAELIIKKSTPEQLQIKYEPDYMHGITALFRALHSKKQTENMKLMIEKGGLELLKLRNATGLTVLHQAINLLYINPYLKEIIELMIEKADLDLLYAQDVKGKTPLDIASIFKAEDQYISIVVQIQKKLATLRKNEELKVPSA